MANVLTKAQILAAEDLQKEMVGVPEWGGGVYVATLTGTDRDRMEQYFTGWREGRPGFDHLRARVCSLCIVDEDGARMFADADIKQLGAKSAAGLQRVFDVAMRLNGMTKEDIDELAGNSESGHPDGSASGSP